jgi:hypothetical protein
MNRLTETVTKIPAPHHKLHLHLSWGVAQRGEKEVMEAVGCSLSHQQKDFDSDMSKALDALASCLNRPAILKNTALLRQIVDGLHDAIESGP